jgi:hypothetical protein
MASRIDMGFKSFKIGGGILDILGISLKNIPLDTNKTRIIFALVLLLISITIDYRKFRYKFKDKSSKAIVYLHQYKSLKDQYIISIGLLCFCIFSYFLNINLVANYILMKISLMSIYFPTILYLFSEIKHVSPKDYIGKQIEKEGKLHYIKVTIISLILSVMMINRVYYLLSNLDILIISITTLLIFILSMADLFQNGDSYNDDKAIENIKGFLCVFPNLLKVMTDTKIRSKRIGMLKYNLTNIYLGTIETIKMLFMITFSKNKF